MYSYIIGKIISINKKSITLENNFIGYIINVGKPELFEQNKINKIYLYQYCNISNKNSLSNDFYGFKTYEEKLFFLNCLSINGVGPKTAINFLQNDVKIIKKLICSRDEKALENLPGIGKKHAHFLIDYLSQLYLKNKIDNYDNVGDIINVLKSLGYSNNDINFAIDKLSEENKLNVENDISDIVSNAIKIITVKNETQAIKA